MDRIFIRQLRVETVIGIYEWERRIRQPVVMDMEVAIDVARAAGSDRVEDTLNYKALSKRVVTLVEESECQLVETLAERVAQMVLAEFEVPWVRLRLDKIGALSGAEGVGVEIERGVRPG